MRIGQFSQSSTGNPSFSPVEQIPRFGFMSARIQTWLPFRIQICVNGREWLARSMDAAGLHYVQRDNCFTWLEHPERVQRLMDQQSVPTGRRC